ncbi:MAG TPA: hypothetical protein VIV11_08310 [Kofleriaceae bacterium]
MAACHIDLGHPAEAVEPLEKIKQKPMNDDRKNRGIKLDQRTVVEPPILSGGASVTA